METLCWYCGAPAAHHGMCFMHSAHFNGLEKATQLQKEHDEKEANKSEAGQALNSGLGAMGR